MTTGARIISLLLLTLLSACANRTFSVSIERVETETPSAFSLPSTWTPSPTLYPPYTPTFFPTYTPVPPLAATVLPTSSDPILELRDQSERALLSPNGQWSASFDSDSMQIVNQNTNQAWTLPCTLFKECSVIMPVKWSSDSSSLFFAPEAQVAESPVGIRLYTAAARIDMETGTWENVLNETNRYYDFAVSNDDNYLAYTQPQGNFGDNNSILISVLNLRNGHETKYSLDGFVGGNIVWSPYTSRFVFQIQDPVRGSSLLYYDMDADVLRYILKDEKSYFQLLSWGDDNLVSLQKIAFSDRSQSSWVLNPFTNEITPAPASS
jgi:hypothetical protein